MTSLDAYKRKIDNLREAARFLKDADKVRLKRPQGTFIPIRKPSDLLLTPGTVIACYSSVRVFMLREDGLWYSDCVHSHNGGVYTCDELFTSLKGSTQPLEIIYE
jgi:hypothetical protein|nr:MAG TPA: hypothetical protein [Caudoviricetes sp.]